MVHKCGGCQKCSKICSHGLWTIQCQAAVSARDYFQERGAFSYDTKSIFNTNTLAKTKKIALLCYEHVLIVSTAHVHEYGLKVLGKDILERLYLVGHIFILFVASRKTVSYCLSGRLSFAPKSYVYCSVNTMLASRYSSDVL